VEMIHLAEIRDYWQSHVSAHELIFLISKNVVKFFTSTSLIS